jgi:hypothetical protein
MRLRIPCVLGAEERTRSLITLRRIQIDLRSLKQIYLTADPRLAGRIDEPARGNGRGAEAADAAHARTHAACAHTPSRAPRGTRSHERKHRPTNTTHPQTHHPASLMGRQHNGTGARPRARAAAAALGIAIGQTVHLASCRTGTRSVQMEQVRNRFFHMEGPSIWIKAGGEAKAYWRRTGRRRTGRRRTGRRRTGGALEGGVLDGGVLDGGVLDGGVLDGGVLEEAYWRARTHPRARDACVRVRARAAPVD